jgi:mediator of RNA polymerase II transcription subunit 22
MTVWQIGTKDKFRIAQEAFQAQCRAESMVRLSIPFRSVVATHLRLFLFCLSFQVRAANSLLSTVHSMKLLLLLSDEAQVANRRDAARRTVRAEADAARAEAAALLDSLLTPSEDTGGGDEEGDKTKGGGGSGGGNPVVGGRAGGGPARTRA